MTRGSEAVAIAILDTGIDQSHEDLQDQNLQDEDLQGKIVKNHNVTKNRTFDDKNGHGTHVAGSAAAVTDSDAVTGDEIGVAGTCPNCVLYNVKVVGNDGVGTLSWLAKGITWAADNDAKVVNMSLGSSSDSRTLKDAVKNAWEKGVVLVAAAGNKGVKKSFYPADYDDYVIAVAATKYKDAKPRFSNYGDWVDVGAPGVNILSTAPDHPNDIWGKNGPQYGTLKRTSMATPHVAGLIWAATDSSGANICSTNDCVRDRILTGADQIPGLAKYWTDGRRLNANNAVTPPSGP